MSHSDAASWNESKTQEKAHSETSIHMALEPAARIVRFGFAKSLACLITEAAVERPRLGFMGYREVSTVPYLTRPAHEKTCIYSGSFD